MLAPRRMACEIEGAQATLRELTGVEPRWFRAVVGMANPFVSASLSPLDLARVAWSVRGLDPVTPDPARVVAPIESGLAGSETRRGGKERVGTWRPRWSPSH